MTTTVPFTLFEEAVHHIEDTLGSWNVQIEVETTERIDLDRLREAAVATANAHPLARATRQESQAADLGYVWEIPDSVDAMPVEETGVALPATRDTFYGTPFDVTEERPFRLLVARGEGVDGGDRLLVSASHVAVDGVGALRIARSVCQAYRGEAVDEDPVDLAASRDVLDEYRTTTLDDGAGLVSQLTHFVGNSLDQPARIARDTGRGADGWGFVHRRLDDLTPRVVEDRPAGASVNDVLLAALHLAIERWNDDHGKPARKVSTMMPVNLRPEEWFYDVVGMYATFRAVKTHGRNRRDPTTAVECVADQTEQLKDPDRAAAPYRLLQLVPSGLPVGLKRQFPELLRGLGDRLLDTAVLSNLGRVPEPPKLAADDPANLWFSPPCLGSGSFGVGVGVATVGGTIHLVFRHGHEQFDAAAAERFADTYVDELAATVT